MPATKNGFVSHQDNKIVRQAKSKNKSNENERGKKERQREEIKTNYPLRLAERRHFNPQPAKGFHNMRFFLNITVTN